MAQKNFKPPHEQVDHLLRHLDTHDIKPTDAPLGGFDKVSIEIYNKVTKDHIYFWKNQVGTVLAEIKHIDHIIENMTVEQLQNSITGMKKLLKEIDHEISKLGASITNNPSGLSGYVVQLNGFGSLQMGVEMKMAFLVDILRSKTEQRDLCLYRETQTKWALPHRPFTGQTTNVRVRQ